MIRIAIALLLLTLPATAQFNGCPAGFCNGGGGSAPPMLTAALTDHAEDNTAQTTYTWSARAFAIGAPAPSRVIVAAITFRNTNAAQAITSVTIGGVLATAVVSSNSGTAGGFTVFYQAAVPTGTTATVSMVLSTTGAARAGCALYAITGSNGVAPTGGAIASDPTNSIQSGTITVPANGLALVAAGRAVTTVTLTATPTNWTQDLPSTNIGNTSTWYTAGQDGTAGSRTYTVTWSGGVNSGAVFAAWGP